MNALLAASLYDWLMFLDVLAAMVWVGGLVTLTALCSSILRSGNPDGVARFSATARACAGSGRSPLRPHCRARKGAAAKAAREVASVIGGCLSSKSI